VFHRRVFRVRVRDAGYYFFLNAHKGKIVWAGEKKDFIYLIINQLQNQVNRYSAGKDRRMDDNPSYPGSQRSFGPVLPNVCKHPDKGFLQDIMACYISDPFGKSGVACIR
jgi:hypothetical protein